MPCLNHRVLQRNQFPKSLFATISNLKLLVNSIDLNCFKTIQHFFILLGKLRKDDRNLGLKIISRLLLQYVKRAVRA